MPKKAQIVSYKFMVIEPIKVTADQQLFVNHLWHQSVELQGEALLIKCHLALIKTLPSYGLPLQLCS